MPGFNFGAQRINNSPFELNSYRQRNFLSAQQNLEASKRIPPPQTGSPELLKQWEMSQKTTQGLAIDLDPNYRPGSVGTRVEQERQDAQRQQNEIQDSINLVNRIPD